MTCAAIPFTLYPLAEQYINSAVTGLLTGATPFFTGLFGAVLFGRVPARAAAARNRRRLRRSDSHQHRIEQRRGTAIIGVVMVLLATVCYGYASNLAAPLQHKYGSVPVMAWMLALAAVWTAPFGFFGLTDSGFAWGPALAVVVLGVVGTGLAFVFMASLVGRVGGPRASFITYLIPVVALALGSLVLGETVTPVALAGVALALGGAVLASTRER